MSSAAIKKELNRLDKDQIIDLVLDIYKKSKTAKLHLDFFANPDERSLLETYRQRIIQAFPSIRGKKIKIKKAKEAIVEFKKLGCSADLVADLMFFYVEYCIHFSNRSGYVTKAFLSSVASGYATAILHIDNDELRLSFKDRAFQVLRIQLHADSEFIETLTLIYKKIYRD